jgi:hypothetical protein
MKDFIDSMDDALSFVGASRRLLTANQHIESETNRSRSRDADLECVSNARVSRNRRIVDASRRNVSRAPALEARNHDPVRGDRTDVSGTRALEVPHDCQVSATPSTLTHTSASLSRTFDSQSGNLHRVSSVRDSRSQPLPFETTNAAFERG